ncbi:MAG: hypothetical protein HN413_08215 [Chloroflexi bacterium]|jgi:hypothetical protein|nr:hypothetical protein [Chloroflexota bacterium]
MKKWIFIIIALLLTLSACNMPAPTPTIEQSAGAIHTVAAQTVEAQMTQVANQPQANPTQGEQAAAPTMPPPTATIAIPTNTPVPPTNAPPPTATPIPCDFLTFGDPIDVTIPDGTDIAAGAAYTKTWRLKNGGSCTWTSGYHLIFISGDNMGAPAEVAITAGTVSPGQTVDVSVNLVAPLDPGVYRGYFKLRNPGGLIFGWGPQSKSFWAEIEVPTIHGVMLDFLAKASGAEWGTGTEPINFDTVGDTDINYGGPDTDANGFAMIKDAQKLEDGKLTGKILETHPKWVNNSYIIGRYEPYTVGAGDYIQAKIGFIAMPDGSCGAGNAIFRIYYAKQGETTYHQLGTWTETCDSTMRKIKVELDSLVGQTVRFYLVVLSNGDSGQDWAVWDSLGVMR